MNAQELLDATNDRDDQITVEHVDPPATPDEPEAEVTSLCGKPVVLLGQTQPCPLPKGHTTSPCDTDALEDQADVAPTLPGEDVPPGLRRRLRWLLFIGIITYVAGPAVWLIGTTTTDLIGALCLAVGTGVLLTTALIEQSLK